jgi:hypothetical protein
MRAGDDRVKAKEYENVAFHSGESVDDFTMRINGLVASLRELSEEMEDSRVVTKILCVILKKFRQVGVVIEMLVDLNTMTVEQLVGRLCVAEAADAEDVADGVAVDGVGRLLTEKQWEAHRRQRSKERSHGGDQDKDDDDTSSTSSGASKCVCLQGSYGNVGV